MAVNDVYQIVCNHILAGKETTNALFYRESVASSGSPEITAGELAKFFFDNVWVLDWKQLISDECRLSAIWAQMLWPTLETASYVPMVGETGLVAGESLPNGSAVMLSGKGENPAQNFWRRIYVAGLPEGHQQGSQVIASARPNWSDLASTLRTLVLDPGLLAPGEFVPASYSRALSLEAGPQPTSDLFSLTVNWAIKSQRRRNLKHGTA